MDHIDDLTNEHLKEFFLKDLNTMNQLIAFQYPNWIFDDYSDIDEHVMRCQRILKNYIINELSDCGLSGQEKEDLCSEKFHEVMLLCKTEIEKLFETASFKTIDLIPDQESEN